MKRRLVFGVGLSVVFFVASIGPLGGPRDQVLFVALLLFVPVGVLEDRWGAVLYGFLIIPPAFLADAIFRPGLGLDSVLATPAALFLVPVAAILVLVGVGARRLVG